MINNILKSKKLNNEIVIANNMDDVTSVGEMLNAGYEWIVKGIPKVVTPIEETANQYSKKYSSKEEAAKALIKTHIKYSAYMGFFTGLGGVMAMPVTIPTDLVSVTMIQLRLVAGLAKIGGYDLKDDEVKTFIMACLTGQTLGSVLKDTGINVGEKLAVVGIKKIPGEAIKKINHRVGFTLLTKFGEKGVINIGKAVPVVGGVVGGGFDAATTILIANNAYKMFIGSTDLDEEELTGCLYKEGVEECVA